MAGSTPIYGFPYPEATDLVADYPALGQELAEDIETEIAAAGGMALIDTTTFSAVSSVSLNNVFSATYDNYSVLVNATASVGSVHKLRMRVAGADNTASNYFWARMYVSTSTVLSAGSASDTSFNLYFGDTYLGGRIAFLSPFSTAKTHIRTDGGNADNDVSYGGGDTSVTTSYDGFTYYPSSGTITGSITVYGLKA